MTHGTTIGDNLRPKLIASLVAACFAAPHIAEANPVGASVAVGQATFAAQGSTLNVTNSPGAVINWQGFSIGSGETTRFIQQSAASSVLNRVLGADPSVILGNLQSNGKVFLINPAGIMVGQGARIDVAGFVASTLNISNQDFANGRLTFQSNPMAGSVTNAGLITTPEGGNVFLVAPSVSNSGVITAQQGQVILAAGNSVQLVDTGAPGVRVEVTTTDNNKAENLGTIIANSGKVGIVGALVRNSGRINADQVTRGADGKVYLRAKKDVTLDASSVITANGDRGGDISIQAETGTALVSGRVEATGSAGAGGSLKALGQFVGLTAASLDASGSTGGGSVLIGGDFQGGNADVQNAWRTFVGSDVSIKADATAQGDGGKVIVWSDDTTRYYGSISARGGVDGGNGGFVETSGKHNLVFRGTVDTGAQRGNAGTLLLDPDTITIMGTSSGAVDGNDSDGSNVTLTGATVNFADSPTNYTVYESELEGTDANIVLQATSGISTSGIFGNDDIVMMANRNITIQTRNASGSGDGSAGIDLTISNNGPIKLVTSGTGTITLQTGTGASPSAATIALGGLQTAGGAVNVSGTGSLTAYANISTSGGAVNLTASGAIGINENITTGAGNINITGNSVSMTGNGVLTTTSGQVSIEATGSNAQILLYNGASRIVTSNATVTLKADNMDLSTGINAGTAGAVTLTRRNANVEIDVGGSDTTGVLGLTQSELNSITAGSLTVGDTTSTGGLRIASAVSLNAPVINLLTSNVGGSQIVQNTNATITASKVYAEGTYVTMTQDNVIDTFAGKTLGGTLTVTSLPTGVFTIGTVGSNSGIQSADQVVINNAGGNGIALAAGNITAASSVSLFSGAAITDAGGVTVSAGTTIGLTGTSIGASGNKLKVIPGTGQISATASTGGIYLEQSTGNLLTSKYTLDVAGNGQNIALATTSGSITVDSIANFAANTNNDNFTLKTGGSSKDIIVNGGITVDAASLSLEAGTSGNVTISGGTVTLNAPTTIQSTLGLKVSGANTSATTLQGTGAITANGDFLWSGGTITGTGALTTNGNSTLSGNDKSLLGRTWTNASSGNVTWSSGVLQIDNGATFNNAGLFTTSGALDIINSTGSSSTINNSGTWTKSGSSNSNVGQPWQPLAFNNTGTVNVNSGTLLLWGNGTDTGNYNIANTEELIFRGGTRTLASGVNIAAPSGAANLTVNGATVAFNAGTTVSSNITFRASGGTTNVDATGFAPTALTLDGGNANINSTLALTALTLSSGTLSGSGAISVSQTFDWSGGGIQKTSGTPLFSTGSSSTSTLSSGTHFLDGRTWENSGIVNFTGGDIRENNSAVLRNMSSGTFNLASTISSALPAITATAGTSTFDNQGTLNQTFAGTSRIASNVVSFNNNGTINVNGGTLQLDSGFASATNSGAIYVASGMTLSTNSTSFTNASGKVIAGSGTIDVGTGTFTNSGTLRPGGQNTTGILSVTGNLTQSSSGTLEIDMAGTTVGSQYDRLAVSGVTSMNGTLSVVEQGGFSGKFSDSFLPLTYGSRSGVTTFSTVNTTATGASATYGATYNSANVSLALASGTTNYTATGSTNWNVNTNWDRGTPNINADAVISPSGTNIIAVDSAASAKSLSVSANNTLNVSASATLNIANTLSNSGTINILADSSGFTALTVGTGITNSGLISLANENGNFHAATLNLTTGTLNNAVGATVRSQGPSGATNILNAQVTNLGTIDVVRSLSVTNTGRTFTSNAGELDIASGTTLTVSGGTTTLGSGTVFGGTGTLSLTNTPILNLASNLTLPGSSITLDLSGSGAATVTAASAGKQLTVASGATLALQNDTIDANVSLSNSGTVNVAGTATSYINGTLANNGNATLSLTADSTFVGSALTVASGFTNNGLIVLNNENGNFHAGQLTVTSGTLTNALGATIRSAGPSGATNILDAVVTNLGTIDTDRSLSVTNAGRTFTSSSGELEIDSGTFLIINGGTTTLGSGTTFTGNGTLSLTNTPILNLASNLTLPGSSITLDLNGSSAATVTAATAGKQLTVASGATLALQNDTIDANVSLSNSGTVNVAGTATSYINGTLSNNGNATLSLTADSTFVGSALTVASGFTNNGLIVLNNENGNFHASQLTVTSGTLNNAVGATLRSQGIVGTANVVDATVGNLGTIDVVRGMNITNLPTSNGTINYSTNSSALTLSNGAFTNAGTIAPLGGVTGTLSVGSFTNAASTGLVDLSAGSLTVTSTTQTNNGTITLGSSKTYSTSGSALTTAGLVQGTGTVTAAGVTNTGTISPGATGVPGTLTIASNVTNSSGGVISGSGTLNLSGNTLTNNGTINPGGAGTVANLTISGNLVQGSNGTIALDLGGTGANQYDQLAVTGTASLNGTLSLSAVNGYVNNPSDSLTGVVTYASKTGTFSSVTGTAFNPSLTYGATSLDLLMQILQNSWIGSTGGSWYTTSNWSLGHAPTSSEDVTINDGGTASLITIVGSPATARSITMTGDDMLSIDTSGTLSFAQPSSFTGSTTLRVTAGGTLNVNGTLNAANLTQLGGMINVNAATTLTRLNLSGGQMSGAGNLTVSNVLSDSGGGNINLSGALSITQAASDLALSSALTGSTVNLTSSGANISLANASVHGTTISLNASGGLISQGGSGAVVATTLSTTSGSSTTMNGSGNQFANASFNSGGGINLFDTTAFNISSLSGGGSVSLHSNAGITQSGAITNTPTLTVNAGGPVTLTNTGNTFGGFGGSSSSGAVSVVSNTSSLSVSGLSTSGALSIDNRGGGIGINGAVSSSTSVVLLANGAISQSLGISTPQLYAATFNNSGYNITLNSSLNSIGNVDLRALNAAGTAGSGGAIDFRTSGSLAIGSAGYGIVTGGNAKVVAGGPISQTARVDAISFDFTAAGGINLPISSNAVDFLKITNSGSGAVVYNNSEPTLALTGITQSGGGGVTIANNGAISTSGTLSNSGGAMLLAATGGFSGTGNVSATGSVGLFGTGLSSSGTVSSTSGAITLDARTGLLTLGGVVTGNGQAVNLYGGDMAIGALVNNPTGNIVVNNMSGGAVTLGGGLAGFGLSNAELNLLKAANLTLNLSPATVDGAVNLSGVGALNINATSMTVNNDFSTSGALTINCTSDVSVNASSSPVSISGSSVSISAANVILNGGSVSGAKAGITSTAGALNISTPSTGSLKLVSGTGGAGMQSAGNLVVNTGTCANCTGNLVAGAGGTLSVVQTAPVTTTNTTAVVETVVTQQQQSLVSTVITSTNNATGGSTSGTTSDTSGTVGTGGTPGGTGGSTILLASAGSTPQPLKTDPNGVAGGDSGSFGGSSGDSNATGGSGSNGSGAGTSGTNGSNGNKDSKDDKDDKNKQANNKPGEKGGKKPPPKNSCG